MKTLRQLCMGDIMYEITGNTVLLVDIREPTVLLVDIREPKVIAIQPEGINIDSMLRSVTDPEWDTSCLQCGNVYYFTSKDGAINKIKENIRTGINARMKMIQDNLDHINALQEEFTVCLIEQEILEAKKELPF